MGPEADRRRRGDRLGLLITLTSALAVAAGLLLSSSRPGAAVRAFFLGPFSSVYAFGNMLDTAAPLILGALGFLLAMRAGLINLGGDGQVYAAGLVAVLLASTVAEVPRGVGILFLLAGSAAGGGLLAGLSGWLKRHLGTTELISTYLVAALAILICDWLITGPLDDPGNNLMATRAIAPAVRLASLLRPSNLNSGALIALLAVGLSHGVLFQTRIGYELRLTGANPEFARYGGVDVGRSVVLAMVLSGALHGLAGGVLVLGTQYRAVKGFALGVGWNALAVALIARLNPLWVVPAALFYAYLDAGAKAATLTGTVTYEMILIVQAVLFYSVTAHGLVSILRSRRRGRPERVG